MKNVEASVGRTPTFRNGPRVVDLDILFYDDIVMDDTAEEREEGELDIIIPHARLSEREFALRPLAEYVSRSFLPEYRWLI